MTDFKVGDVVRLKSGSPRMVVMSVNTNIAVTEIYDNETRASLLPPTAVVAWMVYANQQFDRATVPFDCIRLERASYEPNNQSL